MKTKRSALLICMILVLSLLPVTSYANNIEITPYAHSTVDSKLTVYLNIPAYTSPNHNYVEPGVQLPVTINYRFTYNLNTGEITSVKFLTSEFTPGLGLTPNERGHVNALNNENCTLRITGNGYTITCNYGAQVSMTYYEYPGIPYGAEAFTKYISANTVVVDPERD